MDDREPAVASVPKDDGASDGEPMPGGAKCPLHDDAVAVFTCARCGTFGCSTCLFATVRDDSTCMACARKGLGEAIPWERAKEIGWWRAFWDTVRLSTRRSREFFRTPATHGSPLLPLGHAVLSSTLGMLLTYVVTGAALAAGGGAIAAFTSEDVLRSGGALLGFYGCALAGMSPLVLFAAPANTLVAVGWAAAAAHGTLAIANKATARFEDTLRAVCYANAPYVWQWVPLVGALSYFWMLRTEVIAVRETHGCGTDWALAAVLVHRGVLFFGFIAVYALLIAGSVMMSG